MHTYIHACMHACVRACMCACVYIHMYVCVRTIDCGVEFVNNIETINLNLVTKCFLTEEPLLIVGLNLLMILSL